MYSANPAAQSAEQTQHTHTVIYTPISVSSSLGPVLVVIHVDQTHTKMIQFGLNEVYSHIGNG